MDKEITGLSKELGERLKQKGMTMVTAESCTAGGIAYAITEITGSSAWFDRGFVTYSNSAKIQMLQVKQLTLEQYGAVSENVAMEMAEGALMNSHADLAISVTGITGPGGGTENKPVGMVYFACKNRDKDADSRIKKFTGGRAIVRQKAIKSALEFCIKSV
jgi:nicotinamide-nucleotide amidase